MDFVESVQKNLKRATLFARKVAQTAKNDLRNVSTVKFPWQDCHLAGNLTMIGNLRRRATTAQELSSAAHEAFITPSPPAYHQPSARKLFDSQFRVLMWKEFIFRVCLA